MHPAFSVIFFTVFSGAGYGIWFWIAFRFLSGPPSSSIANAQFWLPLWALGFVMVVVGLLSSTAHLGKPLRAWRAFSQWKTSWLSREGVIALLTFLPSLALAWMVWSQPMEMHETLNRIVAGALAVCSVLTIYCTGMIYASLRPIPEWHRRDVPWIYILAGLASGGVICALGMSLQHIPSSRHMLIFFTPALLLLGILKWRYWRQVNSQDLRPSLAAAVGLPGREVRVFEKPNTEANYLNKEMGYVVARKHGLKLQKQSFVLMVVVPLTAFTGIYFDTHEVGMVVLAAVATVSSLLGTLIERWVFFAQASHVVDRYYRG